MLNKNMAADNVIKRKKYSDWCEAKYAYQKVTCEKCGNMHTMDESTTYGDDTWTCPFCYNDMPKCGKCSVPGEHNVRFAFILPSDIMKVPDTGEQYLLPDAYLGYYEVPEVNGCYINIFRDKRFILCCPCCFSLTNFF